MRNIDLSGLGIFIVFITFMVGMCMMLSRADATASARKEHIIKNNLIHINGYIKAGNLTTIKIVELP